MEEPLSAKSFIVGLDWDISSYAKIDNIQGVMQDTVGRLQKDALAITDMHPNIKTAFAQFLRYVKSDCVWLTNGSEVDDVAKRIFPHDPALQALSSMHMALLYVQRRGCQMDEASSIFNTYDLPVGEGGWQSNQELFLSGCMYADLWDVGKKCKFILRERPVISCLEFVCALSQGYYLIPVPQDWINIYKSGRNAINEIKGHIRRAAHIEQLFALIDAEQPGLSKCIVTSAVQVMHKQWQTEKHLAMMVIAFIFSIDDFSVIDFVCETGMRTACDVLHACAQRNPSAAFLRCFQKLPINKAYDGDAMQTLSKIASTFVDAMFNGDIPVQDAPLSSELWFSSDGDVRALKQSIEQIGERMGFRDHNGLVDFCLHNAVSDSALVFRLSGTRRLLSRVKFGFSKVVFFIPSQEVMEHLSLDEQHALFRGLQDALCYMRCYSYQIKHNQVDCLGDIPLSEQVAILGKQVVNKVDCADDLKKKKNFMQLFEGECRDKVDVACAFHNTAISVLLSDRLDLFWAYVNAHGGNGHLWVCMLLDFHDKRLYPDIIALLAKKPQTREEEAKWCLDLEQCIVEQTGMSVREDISVAIFNQPISFLEEMTCWFDDHYSIVANNQPMIEAYGCVQKKHAALRAMLGSHSVIKRGMLMWTRRILCDEWENCGLAFLRGATLFWRHINTKKVFAETRRDFFEFFLSRELIESCRRAVEPNSLRMVSAHSSEYNDDGDCLRFYIGKILRAFLKDV